MSWLERAKGWLGVGDAEAEGLDAKDGRPPLDGLVAVPKESIEDALVARERGDTAEMRKLLRQLDRGHGLRALLRATAALEAGDEGELAEVVPRIAEDARSWRRSLQVAGALDDAELVQQRCDLAEELGAPKWALGWTRALSSAPATRRRGLVELLIADPALARTVAARDLSLPGCEADHEATERFAAFSYGRDSIRRFGARSVLALLERLEARAR